MSTRAYLSVLLLAACHSHDAGTEQTDAAIVADASPDAATLACVASTTACVGDAIVTCGADGTVTSMTQCDVGCDSSGASPVCDVLEPSNLAATTCDTGAVTNLTVTSGVTAIDTSTGCDLVVTQTTGPAICVRGFGTISIAQGATVRVTGSRALALVATTSFELDGTIDASADGPTTMTAAISGPGAPFAIGNGGNGTANSPGIAGGGGGGGTAGAAGSSTLDQGAGGAAGATTGVAMLSPLIAGSTGGHNGAATNDARTAAGGLGGGALQLVSCDAMTISATAIIDVSGSGGAGGPGTTSLLAPAGGGGGGGGGALLIEGASMTIAGVVAANGGAGGGGGLQGADAVTTGVSGSSRRRWRTGSHGCSRRRRPRRVGLRRCGRCRVGRTRRRRGTGRVVGRGRRGRRRRGPDPRQRACGLHAGDDRHPEPGGDDRLGDGPPASVSAGR